MHSKSVAENWINDDPLKLGFINGCIQEYFLWVFIRSTNFAILIENKAYISEALALP